MSFDPRTQQYESWPYVTKPNTSAGAVGQWVDYLEGTLYFDSAQTQLWVDPVPGPWRYASADVQAIKNFQTWWGLPVTGVVDQQTWGVIDYNYFLHHS